MSIELQSTLSTIFQQLASFFGTSIETVTTNAPIWLAKYGWFCVLGDIPLNIIFGLFISTFAAIGFFATIGEHSSRKTKIIFIILMIFLIILLGVVFPLIRCGIAPEFYGLNVLISHIK